LEKANADQTIQRKAFFLNKGDGGVGMIDVEGGGLPSF